MNASKRRIYLAVLWIATAGVLATAIWRGVSVYRIADKHIVTALGFWALGVVLAAVAVTLLHELGHALFGVFAKMDVQSVGLLGVCLQKKQCARGWQLCRMQNAYAGATGAIPRTPLRVGARYAAMTLGGLIATAFCVCGGVAAVIFAPKMQLWTYALIGGGLPVSVYALLVNALPFESAESMTDGAVLAHLCKKTDAAKVLVGILRVQAQLYGGIRPRDIAEDDFYALPQLAEDNALFLVVLSLRHVYLVDCGKTDGAAAVMQRIEQILPYFSEEYAAQLAPERVIAAVGCEQRVQKIAEQYKSALRQDTPAVCRANAAVCLCKGDREGARELVQRGLEMCEGYRIKGLAMYEKDALVAMQSAIPSEREVFRKPKQSIKE